MVRPRRNRIARIVHGVEDGGGHLADAASRLLDVLVAGYRTGGKKPRVLIAVARDVVERPKTSVSIRNGVVDKVGNEVNVVRAVLRRRRADELRGVGGYLRNDTVRQGGVEIDRARYLLRGNAYRIADDGCVSGSRGTVTAEQILVKDVERDAEPGTVTSPCGSTVTTSSDTLMDTTTSEPSHAR